MKKVCFLIILLLSTISLVSCGASTSYKNLSKVKNEIDENYITFGKDGIVLNGNYNELSYDDFFDDYGHVEAYQSRDYIVAVTVSNGVFYQTNYNVNDKTFIKKEMELENSKSSTLICSNKYTGLISYGNDYVDTAYVIDVDFNIESTILTDDSNVITSVEKNNDSIIFTLKKNGSYKDIIYYNHEFYELGWEENPGGNYVRIIDNYKVTTRMSRDNKPEIRNIYDFANNEMIYPFDNSKLDIEKPIYDYINKEIEEEANYFLPRFTDVKKGKKFNGIIHSYCSSAKWNSSSRLKIDDNYYYNVTIHRDISYIPWLFRGDTDYEDLDANFVFRYNQDNNDLSYVGYSKGELNYLFIF
ncbi:MAG: hypothetical protein K5892_02310 [Acholeplasmatales bacterium]|nr:hypothetical protein [Acholeplasmatales bacterium]